jgi:hypothetical protein
MEAQEKRRVSLINGVISIVTTIVFAILFLSAIMAYNCMNMGGSDFSCMGVSNFSFFLIVFIFAPAAVFALVIVLLAYLKMSEHRWLFVSMVWAVVIVLIISLVLYFLGAFTMPGGSGGTPCIPASGYLCNGFFYSHKTGMLNLTIGQNTGSNWQSVVFAYAPQGIQTVNGLPDLPSAAVAGPYAILSGGKQILAINVTDDSGDVIGPVSPGTRTSGAVWACYSTNKTITPGPFDSLKGCTYVQILTLIARAV